jgi:outer membrane biosynthesis protein TonB
MRGGLTASVIVHVTAITLGFITFSDVERLTPGEVEAIPIELIPIEAFSSIRQGSLESTVIETDTPSVVDTEVPAELAQPTGNTEQDQPTPEDTPRETPAPTIQTAPEAQPVPEPNPVPEPVPAPPDPPAPEPVVEPEPKPEPAPVDETPVLAATETPTPAAVAPVPPPANARVDRARQRFASREAAPQTPRPRQQTNEADKISDIINNEESRGATTGAGGRQTAGKATGTAARLTQSERDALASQMRKCWVPPISALEVDGLTVRLIVDLNRDGSVSGLPRIASTIRTSVEDATAKAAQRAVRRCGPYQLAVEKYDEWRQVDVTFDPQDLG